MRHLRSYADAVINYAWAGGGRGHAPPHMRSPSSSPLSPSLSLWTREMEGDAEKGGAKESGRGCIIIIVPPSLPPSLLAARSPPGVPSGRCKADHQILIRPTWKQPAEINSTAAQLIISLSLVKHARGAEGGSMVCVCVHASQWDRCVRAGLVTVVLSDWWRCAVRRRLGAILCPLGCGGRADGREALDRSYLIKMQMSFRVCVFMHEYVHTCCMCGPARCQGWSLWYLYSHVYIPHTRY